MRFMVALSVSLALFGCRRECRAATGQDGLQELIKGLEKGYSKSSVEDKELYMSALLQTGQFSKGIKVFEESFKENDASVTQLYLYYRLLMGDRKSEKAHIVMGRLKKQLPSHARLLYEQGQFILRQGEGNLANGFFHKAIEVDPLFAPPYYELAKLVKDRKLALLYAGKALSLVDPGSDMAKELLELLAKLRAEDK